MLDEDVERARRAAGRTAFLVVLGFVLACIGVGCFTIGTVEVNRHQSAQQMQTDQTASHAAIKSEHAVNRTTELSKEQRRIRDLAIQDCQSLQEYKKDAIQTNAESEANAKSYAIDDDGLAREFARLANRKSIAAYFADRVHQDDQRAHIARRREQELTSTLGITCTLKLEVGT